MRQTINTVCGEKKISGLGIISPHEHIIIDLTNQFTQPEAEEKRKIARQKNIDAKYWLLAQRPLCDQTESAA